VDIEGPVRSISLARNAESIARMNYQSGRVFLDIRRLVGEDVEQVAE